MSLGYNTEEGTFSAMIPLKVIKYFMFISAAVLACAYASDDFMESYGNEASHVGYIPMDIVEGLLGESLPCEQTIQPPKAEVSEPVTTEEITDKLGESIGDLKRFVQVLLEYKLILSQLYLPQLDSVLLGQVDQARFRVLVNVFGKKGAKIYAGAIRNNFETFISMFDEMKPVLFLPDANAKRVQDYLFLYETILEGVSSFNGCYDKSIIANFILDQLDEEVTNYSAARFSYEGRGLGRILHKSFAPVLSKLVEECNSQGQWDKIKKLSKLLTERAIIGSSEKKLLKTIRGIKVKING